MTTLARNTDPATSHAAAADLVDSGRHASMKERVLDYVREYPGSTTGEITTAVGDGAWKRISDVVNDGWAEYGEPKRFLGRLQQTVWPLAARRMPEESRLAGHCASCTCRVPAAPDGQLRMLNI